MERVLKLHVTRKRRAYCATLCHPGIYFLRCIFMIAKGIFLDRPEKDQFVRMFLQNNALLQASEHTLLTIFRITSKVHAILSKHCKLFFCFYCSKDGTNWPKLSFSTALLLLNALIIRQGETLLS